MVLLIFSRNDDSRPHVNALQDCADCVIVGYCQTPFSLTASSGGQICIWSFRNFYQPVKTLKTAAGVSAVAVSQTHLLAAGLVDGTLLLFDLDSSQVRIFRHMTAPLSEQEHKFPQRGLCCTVPRRFPHTVRPLQCMHHFELDI